MQGKRAAIYVRVSTTAQGDDGSSLGTQEQYSRTYADDRGYQVIGVYEDQHTGAAYRTRTGLSAMRERVRAGEVDVVICYALDRLTRNQAHMYVLTEEIEDNGARLECVTEDFADSPVGRFIRSAKAFAAEIEREKIGERSVRGKRARIESGKLHNHGSELYGYRRNKALGVREIHDSEAAIVRAIFGWVGDEHCSLHEVVRRLNSQSVPPPSAGKIEYKQDGRVPHWGRTQIQRIIRNAEYRGDVTTWKYRSHGNHKAVGVRPDSEWVKLPEGVTPPLVSDSIWHAANTHLDRNTGDNTRNATRPYLLRGAIACPTCGRKMRACPTRNGHVYRCASRETPAGPCGGKAAPGARVESWAWEQVCAVLRDPSIIATERERQRADGPDAALVSARAAALRKIAKIEREQERLISRFRTSDDDSFPWELVEREIGRAEQERKQLTAEVADIDVAINEHHAAIANLDALQAFCARWNANLDGFGFEEKRLALDALTIHVIAGGSDAATWTIEGSVPLRADCGHSDHNISRLGAECLRFTLPIRSERIAA